MYRFRSPDKRRPVVVLSRQAAIEVLHTVMVAPVTSTIRGAPSEVLLGPEHGLKQTSAINLDHVQTVEKARLVQYVGTVGPEKLRDVSRSLALATGCA
jgi:mRNA interferase MazF